MRAEQAEISDLEQAALVQPEFLQWLPNVRAHFTYLEV
jgi:hypothetical protein